MVINVAGSQRPIEGANVQGLVRGRNEPRPRFVGGHVCGAVGWVVHALRYAFDQLDSVRSIFHLKTNTKSECVISASVLPAMVGAHVRRRQSLDGRGQFVVVVLEQRKQNDQHDEREYHRDWNA